MIFSQQFLIAQYVNLNRMKIKEQYYKLMLHLRLMSTNLSIFVDAIQNLFCYQLFEVCYGRLWAAAYKTSLQIFKVIAHAFQAYINLFVQPMEVGFGVCLHNLLVVLLVILRQILRAGHVAAFIEISFPTHFIWKKSIVRVVEEAL